MRRFPHITYYLIGLGVLLFSVVALVSDASHNISIITYINPAFSVVTLIVGNIAIGLFTYSLLKKKPCPLLNKATKCLKWVMLFFLFIFLLEYLLFPVVRAFIETRDLTTIPSKSEFLPSVAYIITRFAEDLLKGMLVTIELSLVGTLVGLILAMILVTLRILKPQKQDSEIVAFLKTFGSKLSGLYVNIFRGTPMMVQAVIIYYLVPVLISSSWGIPQDQIDRVFTHLVAGFIVVSLNTAAYLTEVLRGAIEAIDKGQMEAARSLGLSYRQAMLKIIFPQAIKNALPSIGNEFIINIKDTSVLNVIGVAELFFVGQDAKMRFFRTYEPFIIVALIYLVLTLTCAKLLAMLERKMNLEVRALPSSN